MDRIRNYFVYVCVFLICAGESVFALSESPNFQLIGAGITATGGVISSPNYGSETGGNPASAVSESTSYSLFGGSVLHSGDIGSVTYGGGGGGGGSNSGSGESSSGAGTSAFSYDQNSPVIVTSSLISIYYTRASILVRTDEDTSAVFSLFDEFGKSVVSTEEKTVESNHVLRFTGLVSGKAYRLAGSFKDIYGNSTSSSNILQFTTRAMPVFLPNIANFSAVRKNNSTVLSWSPLSSGINIILVRAEGRIPISPTDGTVVYAGSGSVFVDTSVVSQKGFYYTAFALRLEDGVYGNGVSLFVSPDPVQTNPPKDNVPENISDPSEEVVEVVLPESDDVFDEEITPIVPAPPVVATRTPETAIINFDAIELFTFIDVAGENPLPAPNFFESLSSSVQKKLQSIRADLVDASGKVQIGAYASLSAAERALADAALSAESSWLLTRILSSRAQKAAQEFSQKTGEIAAEKAVELLRIHSGIIDAYGRIVPDVLVSLDAQKKKAVERVLNIQLPVLLDKKDLDVKKEKDEIPPAFVPSEAVERVPFVVETNEYGAQWKVFAGSDALLSVPASMFKKDVLYIVATFSTKAYILQKNASGDRYEARVHAPEQKGKYGMIVQIIYSDNTYEEMKYSVLVDPFGTVYSSQFGNFSLQKPWQWFVPRRVAVSGAVVTLFAKTRTGEWQPWPGRLFDQGNPVVTGGDGAYAFVVGSGEYYVAAYANGYKTSHTKSFVVDKDMVNVDISLAKNWFFAQIIVRVAVFCAILLLSLLCARMLIARKKG